MNCEERQRKILALVERESSVSAGDLARRYRVSRMTIHRDLQGLAQRGLLRRIRGGAVAQRHSGVERDAQCPVCARNLLPHQRNELLGGDGENSLACCATCGLTQFLQSADSVSLRVGDQISGQMLPAEDAFFLLNSAATPCCKPSLLSFARESEAALFQAGFGGSIARLPEALEFLRIADGLRED